jgi:hypothetical protein
MEILLPFQKYKLTVGPNLASTGHANLPTSLSRKFLCPYKNSKEKFGHSVGYFIIQVNTSNTICWKSNLRISAHFGIAIPGDYCPGLNQFLLLGSFTDIVYKNSTHLINYVSISICIHVLDGLMQNF